MKRLVWNEVWFRLFDTNDRFLRWYWGSVGWFGSFGCEMLVRVLPSTKRMNEGRGNGSNWMLGRLNANRSHSPLLILQTSQLFWKSFQGFWLWFAWVLSRSSSATPPCLPALTSSSLLWTPSLTVRNTEYFSWGASSTVGPHSFTLALFHSHTYVFLLWLPSCDFYCKLGIPLFLQVFARPLPWVRA